jgi:ABC-type dipeptide/oligopeptide/nickel transport system ATPase component
VLVTLDIGNAIITFAGLSFLGSASCRPRQNGVDGVGGARAIEQWWVAAFPGLAILTIVVGFNFLATAYATGSTPSRGGGETHARARSGSARIRPGRRRADPPSAICARSFSPTPASRAGGWDQLPVAAGETLGIVGESGSGKTVAALSLIRLLEDPARIVGGQIRFQGRDIVKMGQEELRNIRGDGIAMVFQDPMTSLNPVLKIARQLAETMLVHGRLDEQQALDRSVSLLGRMGITAPERAIDSYPHQFSGGMRQRVMLAMGFANEPSLLIADEPTTALDVTIQAQILDLIAELNRDFNTAIVLISHDLGVIASVCARVVVMYAGEVVEEGPTEAILSDPRHPYTWALINAVPRIDRHVPGQRRLVTIEGAPPIRGASGAGLPRAARSA